MSFRKPNEEIGGAGSGENPEPFFMSGQVVATPEEQIRLILKQIHGQEGDPAALLEEMHNLNPNGFHPWLDRLQLPIIFERGYVEAVKRPLLKRQRQKKAFREELDDVEMYYENLYTAIDSWRQKLRARMGADATSTVLKPDDPSLLQ